MRTFGDLVIDPDAGEVSLGGVRVGLTRTDFDIPDALSGEPRTAFPRRRLVQQVGGPDWYGDAHGDAHLVDVPLPTSGPSSARTPPTRATYSPSAGSTTE